MNSFPPFDPATFSLVRNSLFEARVTLDDFLSNPENLDSISELAHRIANAFEEGHKVLIAGNGGSMADAMHFAEELTGRFRGDRRPLPVISLSDPTHLSCVANDYGFEHVFSRMVEAYAAPGDVVILLTTSGNSQNLVLASHAARRAKAHVFGFLGKDGGQLIQHCNSHLIAPGSSSDRIQEIQMICLHILVEAVEKILKLA